MVKITNTPEEINPKKQNKEEQKLTPELIQQMIRQQDKQDKKETTQLNLRLETSISNQIELQAMQEDTTKTEIIKDILIDFYNNKTLTKQTFNLKEPVTLMIPKNEQLLNDYIEHGINIVSSLKNIGEEKYINPLDPQSNLFTTNYEAIIINQSNNLLDTYDNYHKAYFFNPEENYHNEMDKIDSTIDYSNPLVFLNIHRGLKIISFKGENGEIISLFLDMIIYDRSLVQSFIIDKDRALELARITNNREIIKYIHSMNEYTEVKELIEYNKTNNQLLKENRELNENFKLLLEENSNLKEEISFLNDDYRRAFEEKEDNDIHKYVKELEKQNKELTRKLIKHEKRMRENEKLILEIRDLIRQ